MGGVEATIQRAREFTRRIIVFTPPHPALSHDGERVL